MTLFSDLQYSLNRHCIKQTQNEVCDKITDSYLVLYVIISPKLSISSILGNYQVSCSASPFPSAPVYFSLSMFFFPFISQDMPFSILPSDPCSTYSPGFISNHLAPSSTLTPEPSSLITLPLFIPPIVTSSMSICPFQFPGASSCISCQLLFSSVFWLDCHSGASPLNMTWHLIY